MTVEVHCSVNVTQLWWARARARTDRWPDTFRCGGNIT